MSDGDGVLAQYTLVVSYPIEWGIFLDIDNNERHTHHIQWPLILTL